MWALKKAKWWTKKRRRKTKILNGGCAHASCGHCHHCHLNCSSLGTVPSIPFPPLQPTAPLLPSMHEDWIGPFPQDLEIGNGSSQGLVTYEPSTSYQQYMDPAPAYGVPVWAEMQAEWSTGLCHCEADVPICLFGFFCPCILFGKVAEEMDGGLTSGVTASVVWYMLQQIACFGCVYSSGFRRKLRGRYNLPEKPLPDWLVHCLCWPCAFCQEYRELNMRKMREEAMVGRALIAPPQQQSMTC